MDSYQSVKEEIKRAVDIVELIGQFVQLRKAGQSYLGLCPFHSEKTPSFTVSPAKQMFHCFGCKKGGDLFAFWMSYHQASFPEAVRDLAEKYHIALPDTYQPGIADKKHSTIKEAVLLVNGVAADFYHETLLKSDKGVLGRKYFERRSVPGDVVSEFLLGYAADEWEGLTGLLRKKKADLEKAAQAGLIIPRKNGTYYDRFRGRVIFPIFNLRKQIVGFGGRVLDDSLPKYLNTPETPAFQKGEVLYGLHATYPHIRESGCGVIVEGYMDFLALASHGFHQAVATLGTALTRNHIRSLKGYAREAVVVFDADAAGRAAALRSLPIFLDEGMAARVMVLPQKEDPDSFVNKHGLDAFRDLMDRSVPVFDFYMDQKLAEGGPQVEGRVSALNEVVPFLAELRNDAQRFLYSKHLSERLGISEAVVLAEVRKRMADPTWRGDRQDLKEKLGRSRGPKMDNRYLLDLLVHHPHTVDRLSRNGCRALLSDPHAEEIFDLMAQSCQRGGGGPASPSEVLEKLRGEAAKGLFREVMVSTPIFDAEMVEKVLCDFEEKVEKLEIASTHQQARAKGDFVGLNRILDLKKKRETQESKEGKGLGREHHGK
jgi:DNA primase